MQDVLPRPRTLRIVRPYATEDEFVARDGVWIGRSSIILPGAAAQPFGELVRFEIVLTNGVPVFRGEGTVVSHHPPGNDRPAGLELRFTRIDAHSKALLDHLRAQRAAERPMMSWRPPVSHAERTRSIAPLPIPSLLPSVAPAANASFVEPEALPGLQPSPPSEQSGVHRARLRASIAAPANREEILSRLRERARLLPPQSYSSARKP